LVLEDFLFFSLYSFSCIASNSTTLKHILIIVPRYALRVQFCNIHITCARPRLLQRLLKWRERKDEPGRRERGNVEMSLPINKRSRIIQRMGDHRLQMRKRRLRMMSKSKRSRKSKLYRHKRRKDNLLTQGPKKPP